MALVVGTGTGPSGDAPTNSLSAFYLDNGSTVPGWPVVLNGPIFGSPVIGDVNGDHKNDVVVAACAICTDGRVWAFTGHGTPLWNVVPGATENDHTEILSTPILVDLDGNGVNDVAVGQAGEFHFLRGRDGARLYKPIEVNRVVQNSAAVANFGPGYGVATGDPELAPARRRAAEARLRCASTRSRCRRRRRSRRRGPSGARRRTPRRVASASAAPAKLGRSRSRSRSRVRRDFLDRRQRRRHVHLRQREVLRLDRSDLPLNQPIVGMARTPIGEGLTGWSRVTAASSRSATRSSTARPVRCT